LTDFNDASLNRTFISDSGSGWEDRKQSFACYATRFYYCDATVKSAFRWRNVETNHRRK